MSSSLLLFNLTNLRGTCGFVFDPETCELQFSCSCSELDSLVSNGFVRNGREDILVKALGEDEHSGRVCAVGRDNEEGMDIPEECELYIDGSSNVAAHASVYNLGPTIHNQVLTADMVKVVVTKLKDAKAQVSVPTDEVTTIAEAVNTFIKWPKRLLRGTANKDVDIPTKVDVPPKKLEPICQKLIIFADSTPFQKDEARNVQELIKENLILKLIEASAESS
ncbi:hypothetical protein MTR_6g006270 [Medicago truncatula]|uniref:DUF8039 domain-containing protein n=1 Tax=Medicago truncatula TaxID=3880 RepID=G7KI66_MEDTR|nr:hypothetical protein MTR_6g006270 [Medicago truncatula]